MLPLIVVDNRCIYVVVFFSINASSAGLYSLPANLFVSGVRRLSNYYSQCRALRGSAVLFAVTTMVVQAVTGRRAGVDASCIWAASLSNSIFETMASDGAFSPSLHLK